MLLILFLGCPPTGLSGLLLVAPTNEAVGQPLTPTFRWSSHRSTTGRILQVWTNRTRTGSALYSKGSIPASSTSFTLPAGILQPNTTYYWWVYAGEGENSFTADNAPFSFTTGSS